MKFLFLLFIIVPIIEITVLINVGEAIGAWNTIGLVLLSAFIGVNMLRHQGLSTLMRAQQRAEMGEIPGQEMVEGIVLAVGGALLITPGFVTDVIGFSCLLPWTRQTFAKSLLGRFTVVASRHHSPHFDTNNYGRNPNFNDSSYNNASDFNNPNASTTNTRDNRPIDGDIIEGEYERKD